MLKLFLFALTSLFLIPCLSLADTRPLGWGEAELTQDMETDRPDFTEGTQTVQPGHLQLELGYTYLRDEEGNNDLEEHSFPEPLLRVGLIEDLELRIAWAGYVSSKLNDETANGWTDFSVGFKHRMYQQNNLLPNLSFIAELSLPSGSREFSSDEVEAAGKLLWAYDFDKHSVAGNLNFANPIGIEGRYLEISNSTAVAFNITKRIGTYLEYFGFYPAESVPEDDTHFLNGGFTYAINSDLQIDVRSGFGINSAAEDFFAGLGVSYRI